MDTHTFTESETIGREKWEQYFGDYYNNIQYTDQYDNYDIISYTPRGNNRINWEIKNRDIPHDKYENIMLEKTKYDALINSEGISFFCTFFSDNWYAIWNIRNIDTTDRWIKRKCTATTADGTYGEKKVYKTCIDLFPKEAIRYGQLPVIQK